MTAIATLPVLAQQGTHGARPAASAVGSGALYACTTHGLIYQMLAGSWGTWFTPGGFANPMTTAEDIIYGGASGAPTRKAKGSDGTFLGVASGALLYTAVTDALLSTSDITTNNASTSKHGFLKKLSNTATDYMDGTGNWSTPAGGSSGALTLLEQHTASSSATLDFTTCITSTYDEYMIEFVNVMPASNAVTSNLRASTNGGSSYDSSGIYDSGVGYTYSGGTGQAGASGTALTAWRLTDGVGNGGSFGVSGSLKLYAPGGSSYKQISGQLSQYGTAFSQLTGFQVYSVYKSATAVNAFQFFFSSGNVASGTIRVYGISK